ncbi:hypothetical protein P43SY_007908 [Pythium insidiosum]|uniref:Peptidase A1 domain-containing protein n=1 Tax=Pythium insidiosum TaxID=114742 RepID=A0AAD5LKP5_PYTIN|nr:hypothetical protein P43SY_007908 [Pythium insidiosum]
MFPPKALALLFASASVVSAIVPPHAWFHAIHLHPEHAPVWTPSEFPADDLTDDRSQTDASRIVDITIWNKQNVFDIVDVDIGTPPQRLRLVPLTDDNPTWVFAAPYGRHKVYNHSQSSSFDASSSGAHVSIEGLPMTLAKDRITLGRASSLTASVVFAELTEVKRLPPVSKNVPYDGFLSLGGDTDKAPGLVPSLVQAGVLDEPVFALALRKNANGVLTLGGVNPKLFRGPITYIDTAENSKLTWALPFTGLEFSGSGRRLPGGNVALGGMGLGLFGTPRVVAAALKEIEASAGPCEMMQTFHVCTCSKFPSLKFHMGDGKQEVPAMIAPTGYSARVGPDQCIVVILPQKDLEARSVDWVLGRDAFEGRYVVFDYGSTTQARRIGFAATA